MIKLGVGVEGYREGARGTYAGEVPAALAADVAAGEDAVGDGGVDGAVGLLGAQRGTAVTACQLRVDAEHGGFGVGEGLVGTADVYAAAVHVVDAPVGELGVRRG